jgi:sulfite dehydrogenase (quinone) subunit SoeC
MHPAFSVILFTTLSGSGLGLWFWLGLRIATRGWPQGYDGFDLACVLITGGVLVVAGVLASLWHLGKPARIWRAFSQWQSSWMSREGVLAVVCCALAIVLILIAISAPGRPLLDPLRPFGGLPPEPPSDAAVLWMRIAAAALAPLAAATVFATAMIYASLKPIPAWRHPLVVVSYLLFAAVGGALLFAPFAETLVDDHSWVGAGIVIGAIALWLVKRRYWRDIDRDPLPLDTGDAVGLPGRSVSSFERPHTESNYLTREMGFVVARKHARKLRTIAVVLFAVIPALCALPVWLLPHGDVTPLLWVAAVSFQLGAVVERWLFFAEAKHLVTLYY